MNRIIITPLIGVGDVLMTTPALELLKKNLPDASVTYCTMNQGTASVLLGNPNIDRLVCYPMLGPNKAAALLQLMRECSGRYRVCVNFYPSNRIHYNLFSLATLAPQRIGHTYLRMNFSQANWLKTRCIREDDAKHCVEENVALLPLLGVDTAGMAPGPLRMYLSADELAEGAAFTKKLGDAPVIGVHAGTSVLKNQSARRWPAERFAALIANTPDARFLLFGTAEEAEANRVIAEVNAASGRVTLVADKSIRQVAAIIRACDFFLSNDSGLMHLAAAMATPVVAIIGPTNPAYIYPWGVEHRLVASPTPCRHCFRYSPKPLTCTNKILFECITSISIDMVQTAVNDFLNRFSNRK